MAKIFSFQAAAAEKRGNVSRDYMLDLAAEMTAEEQLMFAEAIEAGDEARCLALVKPIIIRRAAWEALHRLTQEGE